MIVANTTTQPRVNEGSIAITNCKWNLAETADTA